MSSVRRDCSLRRAIAVLRPSRASSHAGRYSLAEGVLPTADLEGSGAVGGFVRAGDPVVAVIDNDSVSVVRLSDGSVEATVPLDGRTFGVVVGHDGAPGVAASTEVNPDGSMLFEFASLEPEGAFDTSIVLPDVAGTWSVLNAAPGFVVIRTSEGAYRVYQYDDGAAVEVGEVAPATATGLTRRFGYGANRLDDGSPARIVACGDGSCRLEDFDFSSGESSVLDEVAIESAEIPFTVAAEKRLACGAVDVVLSSPTDDGGVKIDYLRLSP